MAARNSNPYASPQEAEPSKRWRPNSAEWLVMAIVTLLVGLLGWDYYVELKSLSDRNKRLREIVDQLQIETPPPAPTPEP